jgi:subtilase family serine protease
MAIGTTVLVRCGFAIVAGILLLVASAAASEAEDMVQLTGNHPLGIVGTPAGSIAPDRILKMTITLKVRDPQALNRLLSELQDPASPNYHRWLTPDEFAQRFGPDPAQVNAVRQWLIAEEFEIVSASLQQRSITFTGRADQAERVFRTRIVTYPGGSYANVGDPYIPARFAGVIGAISGLDNVSRAVPASSLSSRRLKPLVPQP